MKPIKVTVPVRLEDGKHEGVILSVQERSFKKGNEDITYVDIAINSEEKEVKASYSSNISEVSMLGKLLMRFGVELTEGKGIDPEKELVGKDCVFQTTTNETSGFSDVLRETVKPSTK